MTNPSGDAHLPEAAERLLARWEKSDVHEVGAQRAGDAVLEKVLEGSLKPQPLAGLDAAPFPPEPNEPNVPVTRSQPSPPSMPSSPTMPSSPNSPSSPSSPSRPSIPSAPSLSASGRPSNPMVTRGRDDLKLLEESLALSTRARRQVALSAPPPSAVVGSAGPLRPSAAPPLRPSTPSMPSPTATPLPSLPVPAAAAVAQPSPQPMSAPAGAVFPTVEQKPRGSIGGLIGGVVGVVGLGVAAAMWLVVGRPQPAPTAAPVAAAPAATGGSNAAAAPASPAAVPAPAAPAKEEEVARSASATLAAPAPAAAQVSKPAGDQQDKRLAAADVPAGPASKGVASWLKSAEGGGSKPTAAPAKESEGPSPGMKPADKGPGAGNLPTQPSQGAVQAALNAVLPRARGCVAGGAPVKATITFRGATGKVLSISVPGADKTVASCVRGALNGAKVSPFAKPTFSASTTVR